MASSCRLVIDLDARRIYRQEGKRNVLVTVLAPGETVRRMSKYKLKILGPKPRVYDLKRNSVRELA
jgi:hypothetical protein